MKKLLCLFTVLLFAGVSFAQTTTSTATVTQYGTNDAEIYQVGTGDNAVITLGSPTNKVTNHSAQGWALGAYISQTVSNNNDASITITGSNDGASIDQRGGDNKAYMNINTSNTKTTRFDVMGADINQIGNNNYASQTTMEAFGNTGHGTLLIDQLGSWNKATQYAVGLNGSKLEVKQYGSNNDGAADVSATTLDNPLALPWAHKPSGDFTQYQNGLNATAHISVVGDGNHTAQYQEYSYGNGTAVGNNTASLDIDGSYNKVAQGQLGDKANLSDVDIIGSYNTVGTSQLGDGNSITVGISGSYNIVGVEQVGNGFTKNCTVTQDGTTNFAQVIQH